MYGVERLLQERALSVLVLFLGLILLDPLIPGSITNLVFCAAGVAGALLLGETKSVSRYLIVILSIALMFLVALAKYFPNHVLESMRGHLGAPLLAMTIALYVGCGAMILKAMLQAREITHHQVIDAVNLYLVLGMFWAHVYTILHAVWPESFSFPVHGKEPASDFVYFSFVTLASLGYGDILPRTAFAQRLAITEAIVGQFYGSVVVAYLLSVYLGRKMEKNGHRSDSDQAGTDASEISDPPAERDQR